MNPVQLERVKTLKELAEKKARRQAVINRRRAEDAREAQELRKLKEL
mgnify:CR=1 FL=1